jgi:hypothetical protein
MSSSIGTKLILVAAFLCFYACQRNVQSNAETMSDSIPVLQSSNSEYWIESFDLDGDHINDQIYFDFSGGAHCCYTINITLSSDKKEVKFPFEMDGGYIGSIDNSIPEQFDIRDIDADGLPEILMQIETYNGSHNPLPVTWQTEYGIKSNNIVIEYKEGALKVSDRTQ